MSIVLVEEIPLEKYVPIIGEAKAAELRTLAKDLVGKTVCHVNSTSFGGGVAEILHRLVPLLSGLGLKAEWKVIRGSDEFFNVTKSFHNGLQGMSIPLTEGMKKTYLRFNQANAKKLELDHDFVVIHDNQPAAAIGSVPAKRGKWVWRCHIDLSTPNQAFIDFLTPFLLQYDALIFTMQRFMQEPLKAKRIFIIPPSIDPLSPKNKHIPETHVLSILDKYDVDPEKPIMTQVGRFDPWKDPLGVIDVYRLVKRKIPDIQLLLIASMAKDDPEGWRYYERTARHAGEDYDIHLLTDLNGVGDIEVNAFQRASDVVLQKSIREGFGLTVTEALWKGIPVIGGDTGGIPLQVIDGETGFLVDNIEKAAEKTVYLLEHPDVAQELGKRGREHVLKNFLITRHVEDYLKLFNSLLNSGGPAGI